MKLIKHSQFWIVVLGLLLAPAAFASGKKVIITGDVYDSACLFTKNLEKPISHECALKCAASGSPLVILAGDGTIYWPIDDKMPAKGQNFLLTKYGAKSVKVTGIVFERGSSKAIVIKQIEEEKPVAKNLH